MVANRAVLLYAACLSIHSASGVTIRDSQDPTTQTPPAITPWTPITTDCTTLQPSETETVWVVIHTETVTLTEGSNSTYVLPYPPIVTPTYCDILPHPPPSSAAHSWPSLPPPVASSSGDLHRPTSNPEEGVALPPGNLMPTKGGGGVEERPKEMTGTLQGPDSWTEWVAEPIVTKQPVRANPIITLTTTDKNPAVTYVNTPPPLFHQPWGPGIEGGLGIHRPTAPDDSGQVRETHGEPLDNPSNQIGQIGQAPNQPITVEGKPRPKEPFTISAGPNKVVINHSTLTDLKPGKTTVVEVDGGFFTVRPTAIVGEGATVARPAPHNIGIAIPTPTKVALDGIDVEVSGTRVIVGSSSIDIPATGGATTRIGGHDVIIGPGTVVVGADTFTYSAATPANTEVIVVGSGGLAAVRPGVVVVHSTTLTYGPGIPKTTKEIDGTAVVIGPDGIVVGTKTFNPPTGSQDLMTFGGANGVTVTLAKPSSVIINGQTFAVGPGAPEITTVIGTETVRIGPNGVAFTTTTLVFPFGSVVTTIYPSATVDSATAEETGSNRDGGDDNSQDNQQIINVNGEAEDEDAAAASRPPLTAILTLCATISFIIFH
ncbi:hypothetical protein B0I35DRAFT_403431 [Stachybotrys elegans]|uniref:Uncharacterized protein n=1 Tax=Stachybotrys elegans TaxID=80388 RepID=A0A8K0WX09_9HYPO|nr:hypothetical protein B0I35DRAFT_403431 [Stachybotrys elegans]